MYTHNINTKTFITTDGLNPALIAIASHWWLTCRHQTKIGIIAFAACLMHHWAKIFEFTQKKLQFSTNPKKPLVQPVEPRIRKTGPWFNLLNQGAEKLTLSSTCWTKEPKNSTLVQPVKLRVFLTLEKTPDFLKHILFFLVVNYTQPWFSLLHLYT
jgi:hypothetical protein